VLSTRDRLVFREAPRFLWASAAANLAVILTVADRAADRLESWFAIALWLAAIGLPLALAAGVIFAAVGDELIGDGRTSVRPVVLAASVPVALLLTQLAVASVILGLDRLAGCTFLAVTVVVSATLGRWLLEESDSQRPAEWAPPSAPHDRK